MTDKNENKQDLSFKEQILRDLENIKKEPKAASTDDLFGASIAGNTEEKPAEEPVAEPVSEAASPEQVENPTVVYPSIEEMLALQAKLEAEQAEKFAAAEEALAESAAKNEAAQVAAQPDKEIQPESSPAAAQEESKAAIAVNYARKASESADYVDSPVSKNPAVKVPHSEILEKAAEKKAKKAKENLHPDYVRSARQVKKKRQNRTAGRIVGFVLVFFLLVLGITGFVGYNYINSALRPIDANSTEYVTVEIPAGSGSKAIGTALEEAGLIRNATVFNLYTQLKNYSGFQSGYYNLQKSMSVDDLAKALQEGGTETPQLPVLAKLTIPEGYTLEQIATATNEATKDLNTKITRDDFMNKVQDETFISQMVAKYPNLLASLPTLESGVRYRLEGYLFPATYNVTSETTVESLIDEMLAAMDTNLVGYYDQITAQNRTVNEVLGLASLVEKEGATDEDRKNIASVFFNRIAQGMPLQSNIAILYAQGKLGQATTLQEDAQIDTNIDSAFNIYRNAGLMPGPVDSPSLSAISAVINPNNTDYLYFVADVKTGQVYFANNYAEHEQNVTTYVNSQLASSN